MASIGNLGTQVLPASTTPLTAVQKKALAQLHQAATKLEGVFLQMVMSAMQDTIPKDSIFGKDDASQGTWTSMLNDERSQAMANQGGFGLAQSLETQLRARVLSDAAAESKANVNRGNGL